MKYLYLSFIVVLTIQLSAQNPLTSTKVPIVGDIEAYKYADTSGIMAGSAGTNQNWNFSGIVFSPTAAISSATYVTASSAPNASLFPSANIASNDGTNYSMFATSSSSLVFLGSAEPTPSNCVVYSNPFTYITFPFAYANSITDTHAYSSGGINANGSTTTTADGTGTLTLPGSNVYGNILRIKINFVIIYSGSFTGTYTSTQYAWYSPVNKFPLLTVNNSTFSSAFGTNIDKSVQVNYQLALPISEIQQAPSSFELFPNPAHGIVNITLNSTGKEEFIIYNSLGEVCKVVSTDNTMNDSRTINIEGLTSGIYYVKLKNSKKETAKKLIIE